MLTEVCVQDINYTSSSPTTAGKMKMNLITAVFVVVACLIRKQGGLNHYILQASWEGSKIDSASTS